MPFAATWVDLEIVILSEISPTEKEKYYMASLICAIEKEMIEMNLTYKTETDSQTQRMNLWLPGGRDSQGVWDGHVHTAIFRMGNLQGPPVLHMELCSMFFGSLDGREV